MNKNKPRSDLRDAKQWVGEIRSTYPCRSHSRNIQMNVVGVVILASPPHDPIRSKRTMGGASERCTRTAQWLLLLLSPARCGGVVDGTSSTMAWCLWWRVYAGRALPTRMRWKKIGKKASQTRAKGYSIDIIAAATADQNPSTAAPTLLFIGVQDLLTQCFFRGVHVRRIDRIDRQRPSRESRPSTWRGGLLACGSCRALPGIVITWVEERSSWVSMACGLAWPGPSAAWAQPAQPASQRPPSEQAGRAMVHVAGPLAGPCAPRLFFSLPFFFGISIFVPSGP
jgi:hypothetical protein